MGSIFVALSSPSSGGRASFQTEAGKSSLGVCTGQGHGSTMFVCDSLHFLSRRRDVEHVVSPEELI